MTPNYTCPLCGTPSEMVVSDVQAFCTNLDCNAMSFNPSLPDQGMSNVHFLEMPKEWEEENGDA